MTLEKGISGFHSETFGGVEMKAMTNNHQSTGFLCFPYTFFILRMIVIQLWWRLLIGSSISSSFFFNSYRNFAGVQRCLVKDDISQPPLQLGVAL